MRPLGIASGMDKIVQKAVLIFLEPVFEKEFLRQFSFCMTHFL